GLADEGALVRELVEQLGQLALDFEGHHLRLGRLGGLARHSSGPLVRGDHPPSIVGPPPPGRKRGGPSSARTRLTSSRIFGSAALAVAMMSARSACSRASGRHMSVTMDRPSTRRPQWTATMTSGTVDMPTTSAPAWRRKRYSARVSRLGPATATKT